MFDNNEFIRVEFDKLNVVIVDNKTYYPATECARMLGYGNPSDAIRKHCDMANVIKYKIKDHRGRTQLSNFISEENLYQLIEHSHRPEAKKIKRATWKSSETLYDII